MSMLLPRYQGMQCYLVRLPEFHFLCCQPVKVIWARKKALNFRPTTLLRKVILICFHKLPRLMYLQSKSFDCFFFYFIILFPQSNLLYLFRRKLRAFGRKSNVIAIIRETHDEQLLEIWKNNYFLDISVDLQRFDKHGKVYTDGILTYICLTNSLTIIRVCVIRYFWLSGVLP
jgi:hypothetical protein